MEQNQKQRKDWKTPEIQKNRRDIKNKGMGIKSERLKERYQQQYKMYKITNIVAGKYHVSANIPITDKEDPPLTSKAEQQNILDKSSTDHQPQLRQTEEVVTDLDHSTTGEGRNQTSYQDP